MPLEPGSTLGHYEIVSSLGAGGMGEVYRAWDTRLERQVAIKILADRHESTDSADISRLLGEARAAARLSHPSIATIYEVAEDEDVAFLVMELVHGETLRSKVGDSLWTARELTDIALAAVRALRAAHERGVVHGDVKPDNLMLTPDGQVKVLDFGVSRRLATLDEEATRTLETLHQGGPGGERGRSIAGTLAYMAPEQMRGDPIEARADLYSLGVVLHELVVGRRPFEAESSLALVAKVMSGEAPSLESFAARMPRPLTRIVERLLAKRPDHRYRNAAEVEVDLEMARTGLRGGQLSDASSPRRVVAILPFQLLSAPEDESYLSLALAQAVSHGLADRPHLTLRPTSAVTRYAGKQMDPRVVASELGAQVVVEGTIQRLGSRMRVQIEAWDAEHEKTLLSLKEDASIDELFSLQDRLAERIGTSLAADEKPRPRAVDDTRGSDRDPEAYAHYLRAGEYLLRASEHDARGAIGLLEECVRRDPGFADGWARLAGAMVLMASLYDPRDRWYEQASSAVARALELDPANPDAWASRGRLLWTHKHGFKHREALRDLGAACQHPRRTHDSLLWYAIVLAHVGLHDECAARLEEALEENPDDTLALLTRGEGKAWQGDFEAAVEDYHRIRAVDPASMYVETFYPIGLIYVSRFEDAEREVELARRFRPDEALVHSARALLCAHRGDAEEARRILATAMANPSSVSHLHHTFHYAAATWAELGEHDRAVATLRRVAETGMPNATAFRTDPHFRVLGSHEGFSQLLSELDEAERGFRAGLFEHSGLGGA